MAGLNIDKRDMLSLGEFEALGQPQVSRVRGLRQTMLPGVLRDLRTLPEPCAWTPVTGRISSRCTE